MRFLVLLLLAASAAVRAQTEFPNEKLDSLLVATDSRDGSSDLFRRLLADPDPAMRARTAVACGSLQDTLLLPSLIPLLRDGSGSVREAAGFAIGQTAGVLSERSRRKLESQLLSVMRGLQRRDRIFEECGKFGSAAFLDSLLEIMGTPSRADLPGVSTMLSRFAIRGTLSPKAIAVLLGLCTRGGQTPWQAVYALQRAGDQPGVRAALGTMASLTKSKDPLVRMNLALLAGKVRADQTAYTILHELRGDRDWRVRVNVARSLVSWSSDSASAPLSDLAAAMNDPSDHVAIAALSALADAPRTGALVKSAATSEALAAIRALAENRSGTIRWQRQAAALKALATVLGPDAFAPVAAMRLAKPVGLVAAQVAAVGATGAPGAGRWLIPRIASDTARVACAALDAVQAVLRSHPGTDGSFRAGVLKAVQGAVERNDVAITTTASALLADSLLRDSSSVRVLLNAARTMRLPEDVEAMQQVIETLGILRDTTAVPFLQQMAASGEPGVAGRAAQAVTQITGRVISAANGQRPARPDLAAVHALPETLHVTLRTAKGDVALELYRSAAPFTVASLAALMRRHFYDGLTFHRVVPNFVVQGGDPRGDGWGGPGFSLRSEFSLLRYETGTIGIASAGKDTEGSQFFITHSPQPHLDGRYTIVGRVTRGMDAVDRLQLDDGIVAMEIRGVGSMH